MPLKNDHTFEAYVFAKKLREVVYQHWRWTLTPTEPTLFLNLVKAMVSLFQKHQDCLDSPHVLAQAHVLADICQAYWQRFATERGVKDLKVGMALATLHPAVTEGLKANPKKTAQPITEVAIFILAAYLEQTTIDTCRTQLSAYLAANDGTGYLPLPEKPLSAGVADYCFGPGWSSLYPDYCEAGLHQLDAVVIHLLQQPRMERFTTGTVEGADILPDSIDLI